MRIRHYAAGRVLYRCPDTRTYRLMLTWDGRRWPGPTTEEPNR